jgi:hypothetical protein
MRIYRTVPLWARVLALVVSSSFAGTAPEQINYQAKIDANGVPFDGVGHFKFAIVDHGGTNTYWSNDGMSTNAVEPTAAVSLNVSGGLLNVMLGNAAHPNMIAIPASTFAHPDAHIRMWFGGADGTAFEHLVPDKPLGSVPYALMAETVPNGSLTGEKLARESVWPVHAGRDNTIVSFFAEYTGSNMVTVATVASNKNFIVTDAVFGPLGTLYQAADWASFIPVASEACCDVAIQYKKGGETTVLLKRVAKVLIAHDGDTGTPGFSAPYDSAVSLRSGLVVPAGATLQVGGFVSGWEHPKACTVSGFEIPVE